MARVGFISPSTALSVALSLHSSGVAVSVGAGVAPGVRLVVTGVKIFPVFTLAG